MKIWPRLFRRSWSEMQEGKLKGAAAKIAAA
jgi:hypothetical protein